jgi:putative NADPH-quinone reductase
MRPDLPQILIIYAHPASRHSRVNGRMADAARALPNVEIRDLYEIYPDFHIDVVQEQEKLAKADLIVFQHPIQWYSMPSLLKEWVDVVLEHGWAYGSGGTALQGKGYWLAITTGGTPDTYQTTGCHGREFAAYLPPFEQTARLCGMRWLPPYILHGAQKIDETTIASHIEEYADKLRAYPNWPA